MDTHHHAPSPKCPSRLTALLLQIPPGRRGAILQLVVSFRPSPTLEGSFDVRALRAAFAECWESRFQQPVPIRILQYVLEPPVPIRTVLVFSNFSLCREADEIENALSALLDFLSPGPYLELYGREELPNSQWTVYGNQIKRRLF